MYDRKRIAQGAGTAIAVWALVAMLVLSTGVAYAVPLSGIGGFKIYASEIRADSLTLYPGVDDTSEMSAYPQAVVELQNARLDDLSLHKKINANSIPGLSGEARLSIFTSGTTDSGNVLVKTSALEAQGATFNSFTIDEQPTSDPRDSFSLDAGGDVTLQNAGIRAHYLATNQLQLPSFTLVFCYNPDGDDTWEYGPC
jgi:hypothetical protein